MTSKMGFTQWMPVDTLSWWPYSCDFGIHAPLYAQVISEDTIWCYYSIGKCSPSGDSRNAIIKTSDSFHSYSTAYSFGNIAGPVILDISFSNNNTFFLYTRDFNYNLYKWSTSTGLTIIKSDYNSWLYDIQIIEDNTGFAISSWGVLYKYENDSLDSLTYIPNCFAPILKASNSDRHFIICKDSANGNYNTLLKSMDDGLTWSLAFHDNNRSFQNLTALNDSSFLLTTQTREVLKSIDGGVTWLPIMDLSNLILYSIVNENVVFGIKQGGIVVKTIDGGATWINLQTISSSINSINMVNEMTGYIFGNNNSNGPGAPMVYKTTNGGIQFVPESTPNNTISLFPNPASNFIYIENPDRTVTNYTVTISNNQGQQVLKLNVDIDSKKQIDVSHLNSGLYVLQLQNQNTIYVSKFIK